MSEMQSIGTTRLTRSGVSGGGADEDAAGRSACSTAGRPPEEAGDGSTWGGGGNERTNGRTEGSNIYMHEIRSMCVSPVDDSNVCVRNQMHPNTCELYHMIVWMKWISVADAT